MAESNQCGWSVGAGPTGYQDDGQRVIVNVVNGPIWMDPDDAEAMALALLTQANRLRSASIAQSKEQP